MRVYILYIIIILSLPDLYAFGDPGKDPITGHHGLQQKLDSALTRDSVNQVRIALKNIKLARNAMDQNKPDSAILYARAIISFDVNIMPAEFLSEALFITGKSYRKLGKQEDALRYYLKTIQKLKLVNGYGCRSEVYQELGLMYFNNGLVKKAIGKYLDAYDIELEKNNKEEQISLLGKIIEMSDQTGDLRNTVAYREKLLNQYYWMKPAEQIAVMQDLSADYVQLGKYKEAVNLQVQIMEFERMENDQEGQFATQLNLIDIYYHERDPENFFKKGIYVFNYMFKLLPRDGITKEITNMKARALILQGKYYEIFGDAHPEDYATALQVYDSARLLFSFTGNPDGLIESYMNLASIFYKTADYKACIDHLTAAINILTDKKDYKKLITANQMLADAYEKMDRYKPAYMAGLQLTAWKDSLYKQQVSGISAGMNNKEENSERTFFQNLEQSYIQQELDTLSEALLLTDIENYRKDIALLLTEKELQEAAIRNQQLEQKRNTQEIELYKQRFLSEKHRSEITRLQNEMRQRELDLKNKQLEQTSKEQQIRVLEQEKKLNEIDLQKSEARRYVLLLSIAIILIVLVFIVTGYINIRKSRERITAQNKLIEIKNLKLQELNQEKNKLIRVVAHDLKNPLSGVLNLTEIMKNNPEHLSGSQIHSLSLIRLSIRRMYEMIIKILDTKAIDDEKINIEFEAVNVKQMVEYITEMFQVKAAKRNIRIMADTQEVFTLADQGYLFQILENLISNALKFTPAGSTIYIRTLDTGSNCRIMIKDEGPGFIEEEMKNLFIKFRKYSAIPTRGENGSGLGLSIVKKYVDLMGGRVWCESEPGNGATFYIEFKKALVTA